MNHTYRLVWNRTLSMFVAVSECARAMGKASGGKAGAVAALVLAAASVPALATPYETLHVGDVDFTGSLPPGVTVAFDGGTLELDTPNTTQDQQFTLSNQGGTLEQAGMAANFTGAFTNAAPGVAGGLTITNYGSGGAITLSGQNTYTGATTITSGATLILAGIDNVLGSSAVVNNGTLDVSTRPSGVVITSLTGNGSVTLGSAYLILTAATGNFGGVASGTGGLAIAGGSQTLSAAQTYTGGTQVWAGATLALTGNGNVAADSNLYVDGTLNLSGAASDVTVVALNGAGSIQLGARNLALDGSSGVFSGIISGSGGLNVAHGGETLEGVNTYTGATRVTSGGGLSLRGTGSIAASSGVVLNNGTLFIDQATAPVALASLSGSGAVTLGTNNLSLTNASGTFTGHIDGAGGFAVNAGTQTLGGVNTYTGATTIDAGATLALAAAESIATSSGVAANGTFDISAATGQVDVTNLSGTGTVALGARTLALTGASGSYDGTIGGTGGLTIAGGQLNLSRYTYYSGQTTVNAGATLSLSGGASLYTSAVVDNGVLDVSASATGAVGIHSLAGSGSVVLGATNLGINTASGVFSGSISGTGGLAITAGTQTFSGVNTYSEVTQVANGATLELTGNGQLASAVQLDTGGILDVSGSVTNATVGNVVGAGAVQLGANTLTLSGTPGNYSLTGTVAGSGGLNLNNGNYFFNSALAYTGATQVNTGASLYLGGSGSIAASSNVSMNGGNLTVYANTGGTSIAGLSGASGNVTVNDVNLTLSAASGTYGGGIGGTGGLTVAGGTQTLSSYAAYTGQTTINSGAALALSGSGALYGSNVVNNGTLDVSGTTYGTGVNSLSGSGVTALGARSLGIFNASGSYAGSFTGTGLVDIVAGTQTLTGASTNNGYFIAENGAVLALLGGGKVANSVVQVQAGGVFDVSGAVTQASAAALAGAGSVHLGNNTLVLNGVGVNGYMFDGAVTGAGGLTFNGGNHSFDTALAYTGATQVNTGATVALVPGASMAASSGVVMNGGTFYLQSAAGTTLSSLSGTSGTVSLNSTLTLSNASGNYGGTLNGFGGGLAIAGGTETLSGSLAYFGSTRVDAGARLVITGSGSGIATSASVLDNGSVDISGTTGATSFKNLSGTGALVLGARTTTLAGATGNFGGIISGTGGVNVSGTLVLAGTNTYSGATTVANGATLGLATQHALANSSVVDNGVLDISAAGGSTGIAGLTGAGTVTLGANDLAVSAAAGTFSGLLNGSGGFAVTGGIQTLSKVQAYTGTTTVSPGAKLILAGSGSIAASSGLVDNGSVDISGATGAAQLATLSGSGALNLGANQLTLTAANGVFGGAIVGTGKLAIAAGTETLSGVSSYTGATTIAAGATLALTTQRAIANSAVVDNGTLDLSASNGGASVAAITGAGVVKLGANQLVVSNAAGTFAGSINGSGGLLVTSGVQTLTGVNTYTGLTEIGVGAELAIIGNGSITSSSGVLDNGTLTVGTNALAVMTSLSGSGTLNLNGQSVTFTQGSANFTGNIVGTGKVVVTGGTQELGGDNTSAGPVSVTSGGTLKVATNSAIGDAANGLILNNGTLESTASFTMARTVAITGTGTLLTDAGTTLAANGAVSGSGTLVKAGAGTLVLGGDNTQLTGGVAVNAGTLQVATAKALGNGPLAINGGVLETTANLALAQNVTVAGGAGIFVDTATTTTLSGAIGTAAGSTGCFSKTGGGTLTLTGSGAFGTGLCVANGMLRANGTLNTGFINVATTGTLRGAGAISGPLTVAGILAPGNSPGTLTTSSSVTMLAGSTFQADINGTGTGTGPGNYSRLLVTGAGQFTAGGATLAPNLVAITGTDTYTAYVPKMGDNYRIITAAGGLVGRFAPLVQPAGLAAGTRLGVFYDLDSSHSIDLRVLPTSYAALVTGNGNAQTSGAVLDTIVNADQAGTATATQSRIASTISHFSSSAVATLTSNLSGQVHAAMVAVAPLAGQAVQATVVRQFDTASAASALWADLGANRAEWDHDAHASGFTANRGQLTIGADAFRNDRYRVGVGYSHARANLAADAGSGILRENMLFAYGQHQGDVIGIDAMAGAGRTNWQTERANPLGAGALVSGLDGRNTLASIGLSTPWQADGATFKPFVRVLWQRTERDAGGEGSAIAALALPEYSASGTRTTAGLSGNTQGGAIGQAPYTMQYSVGIGRDNGALAATHVDTSLAGIASTVLAPQAGRGFIQAAVSGTVVHSANAASYYGIATELHNGRADVSLTGGLRYAF